jgi:hypothetical protein
MNVYLQYTCRAALYVLAEIRETSRNPTSSPRLMMMMDALAVCHLLLFSDKHVSIFDVTVELQTLWISNHDTKV